MDLSVRQTPLSMADAFHLLRRLTFAPTWQQAAQLKGIMPEAALDLVMNLDPPLEQPPWAQQPISADRNEVVRLWGELQSWWISHCLRHPSFREKLVAMWHNHFTSDYVTVYYAQLMVTQSNHLRLNRYNFRALSEGIVGDPAMLRYLNGDQSVKGNPNENFGREWFELFSLGVGNYTEHDIIDAARAFTGWRVNGLESLYNRQLADLGEKTILGQTGNWEYKDVIRITLEQDACASFIATKILHAFVEHNPDEATVEGVAQLIRSNNYNLQPVLRTLFISNGFYDVSIRGALIKDPMSFAIGLANITGISRVSNTLISGAMSALMQTPFFPPTVQGWVGHHKWITSNTFPLRQRFAESLLDGRLAGTSSVLKDENGQPVKPDLVSLVKLFPDANDAAQVVKNLALLLLPVQTTPEQETVLLDIMMAGAPAYSWDIESGTAENRIKLLMQTIVRMPEFQLN
ncbi:MAG: DUF1800 domain-containing protein [Flavobacteriales bacterium]|nr:MAG: hypothetical protein UZ06_CHB003000265 [Chlorobi bacterium OLB6]MBE2265238.1 DUF1800 domain-containing protein [Flavobacteriales bacterium]MBV6463601.1 hypothetical protein [Chlorobiota bacterium]MBW7853438.1 DUF1800 domain-containing protein [Candidatus Kapabacteria bacterium]MCC6330484.1 DUF1800 domain-containing protein [Ignavibacteria bacterium]